MATENDKGKQPGAEEQEKWADIDLSDDVNTKDDAKAEDDDGWEKVEKESEPKQLPKISPYDSEKGWEEIRILQRQTKSLIDNEDWELASFGGRKEKIDLIVQLAQAEDSLSEQINQMIERFSKMLIATHADVKELAELKKRKNAVSEAREVVGSTMDGN